ncbi:hypothetical protein EII14_04975 [Alloprevotella sp. OH1205_COT-284]|uniref:ATP-binding protein n=1 Tax=Alloprevotella sp. OH1205_COT-284 TaxID=2491043 RepID=UPI000F600D9C|nr:ATP-binding protein [Alloprevotella sp. OH1205_COT-284]RRD79870.1 hypothetical protein EII14_04975 [Alloprevotella sp. OH1205_COT-284]
MLTPIALRVLSDDSVGKRKLKTNKVYYLLDGFEITREGDLCVSPYRLEKDIVFQKLFSDPGSPDISISAIVGENGSGKSSLVEFYMRLVNNFAAATLGEYQTNPGSQHLHYIDNIAGEYYYMMDGIPYRLTIKSRKVLLGRYSDIKEEVKGMRKYVLLDEKNINSEMSESPMKGISKSKDDNSLNGLYGSFFYTYISNYSIYAYNTTDYHQECNSNEREALIRQDKKKIYDVEYRNWLNGIFHKNDGYQTPIVLSPFRTEGNIDINTENKLSRERLITLLIMPKSQFRIINGHLKVTGLKLSNRGIEYNAKYLNRHLGLRLQQKGFDKFKSSIVKYWGEMIAEKLEGFSKERKHYEAAVGYLVYKTLKISKKYKQYNNFFRKHHTIRYKIDEEALRKLIIRMSKDHSHITRKIRQTLSYIVYGIYDNDRDSCTFAINKISKGIKDIEEQQKAETGIGKKFIYSVEELVPPPFYDIQIELQDIYNKNPVLFETLSSGERQQTYSISALLYHLSNLDSVWKDTNKQRVAYKHINVVMEEIELYFHPELQRTYIKNLLEGIKQMHISNIRSIHICFVTHSPFVLSDIPSRNILALKLNSNDTDDTEKTHLSTFGANIHDILKDSFFLTKGAIGAYAEFIIKSIIKEMEDEKKNRKADDKKIHERIMLIDEPIIRNVLLEEYHRVFPETDKEQKIKELQRQIDELICGN